MKFRRRSYRPPSPPAPLPEHIELLSRLASIALELRHEDPEYPLYTGNGGHVLLTVGDTFAALDICKREMGPETAAVRLGPSVRAWRGPKPPD